MVDKDLDKLTGLHRGEYMEDLIREKLGEDKEGPHSIAMVDIDYFKQINDSYGSEIGDEVLRKIGRVLKENIPQEGIVGRLRGDEFAILLPDTGAENAFIIMEEIRRLFADTDFGYEVEGVTTNLHVGISIGIASFPRDANNDVELMRKAEEAGYKAKKTGRNRVCLPSDERMILKTSYYTATQLERLAELAAKLEKTEAFLLREALDDLLRKYTS